MAVNSPNSPRQKMINFMYLVFIAMLALNVSAEVLDGFDIMQDSLNQSADNMKQRNEIVFDELEQYAVHNPEKAGAWSQKGRMVKAMSDSLHEYIDLLKTEIAIKADGKGADPDNIKHREDVDAASEVLLSPTNPKGRQLRQRIDEYRQAVAELVTDPRHRQTIENNLTTMPPRRKANMNKNWEETLFEQMPVAAATTILTKIQNDVRAAEGEALASLLRSIDADDFRINRLNAYVVPEADVVIQGGTYKARIVVSAEDSTQTPNIVINGTQLPQGNNGIYTAQASATGTFPVEGYLEMTQADGSTLRRTFSHSYTVVEPVAVVAPALMNVLYAGIDNEVSISVPGFAPQDINATMTNGTISRVGNRWMARPTTTGDDVTISITTRTGTQTQRLLTKTLRTRSLPDPTPFIRYTDGNGNQRIFKGGSISKSILLNAEGIEAAIDDGILNIPFRVKSFRTVFFDSMGDAIPEISDGNRFSSRQKEQIRRLARGRYFNISGVKAVGPDGTERDIAVIEVRVN